MSNHNNATAMQSKDNYFNTQFQLFEKYLHDHVATVAMASRAIGISEKNLCRYVATLKRAERIYIVERKKCQHTGFLANYLSTNPIYKPQSQLRIF